MTVSDDDILAIGCATVLTALVVGGTFAAGVWLQAAQCEARWERSEITETSYGPIQGCLIQLPDGRWIPDDRYREMPE